VTAPDFLVPAFWPAVLLLPLLLAAGLAAARARARRSARTWGRRETELLGREVFRRARRTCVALAVLLAGTALLRPVWGDAPGEPPGPDVVVCLDVSRSMLARDAAPTRLQAAQQAVRELAATARGARLGLVAYAGSAQLAAPLSADVESVAAIAAVLEPGAVARGGSDLGAALDLAVAALRRAGSRAGSILVLGDGEDFAGGGRAAAERARAAGAVVHCLGFGAATGSKIVVDTADGEVFLRDGDGQEVVTALDAAALREIAAAGGGRGGAWTDGAIAALHEAALLPRARAAALADPRHVPAHRFQWPLLAAVLLWLLACLLPERRRGGR